MKRSLLGLAALALLAGPALNSANAELITYTEQAVASGKLGVTSFTNEAVTITFTADTSTVTNPSAGFYENHIGTMTVNVVGAGSATFNGATYGVFNNQGVLAVGTGQTNSFDILDTQNAVFGTYDLKTAIGPVSGNALFNAGHSFSTTAGTFYLTSVSGNTSTFTATLQTSSVPEPGSLALLGMGLFGVGGYALRRRKKLAVA